MKTEQTLSELKRRFPNEPEYHQAVHEVLESIEEVYNQHPEFEKANLIERLCIPERIFSFRVTWVDDKGQVHVNMGYRVQHSNAIGPYKGGIRFHSSVNLSILKFLAFEQTFKNSLTTLPMGGGKGGSDFNPKGKSNAEIMRFCQAFVTELWRHIGPDTDVPAGDIGVGGREVGFMFGMYKKLAREFTGTFTGKGLTFGGSLIRPEATGYGNVYFLLEMLKTRNIDIKGKKCLVSGSGNVAQYTCEKLIELGAIPMTLSDSDGYIYDPEGITLEKLEYVKELKDLYRGRIKEYAEKYNCKFVAGGRPWGEVADIALPSATQNELNGDDAKALVANGIVAVSEGANMPSTPEAVNVFLDAKILYAPGKAANAGGVSVSGLEMSQNSARLSWTIEEVDSRLKTIMSDIHENCSKYGKDADGFVNYVKGANIAGFMKVAKAMMAQGIL
ncbi:MULTISPECIES: NADP-specific glutamate dehydrogenase [unclassified Dysgonomonas]|uniref:NADP-specific glutamate dehydrogenase n=1 Tax=unclassified Dysgonomonas TaxID=2630389 RepID=UPI0006817C91|nr:MULTISPECIES: NADP-specific glutamate dehydrogenase [unclassified Dysgonomonas]MBD8349452.1 NADP-specific glutamate dehydrogenase [Dysgonomonas sp. HGC4]MBF0577946.1 NADP-specific glutamate dehydrogenase [Dysgonomonas sp. GY617]